MYDIDGKEIKIGSIVIGIGAFYPEEEDYIGRVDIVVAVSEKHQTILTSYLRSHTEKSAFKLPAYKMSTKFRVIC